MTCFGCELYLPSDAKESIFALEPKPALLVDHLLPFAEATPLGILAYEMLQQPDLNAVARKLFGSYDRFLHLLADTETRGQLESIPHDKLGTNPLFQQVRDISHSFDEGLRQLFFDPGSRLHELTVRYGVF